MTVVMVQLPSHLLFSYFLYPLTFLFLFSSSIPFSLPVLPPLDFDKAGTRSAVCPVDHLLNCFILSSLSLSLSHHTAPLLCISSPFVNNSVYLSFSHLVNITLSFCHLLNDSHNIHLPIPPHNHLLLFSISHSLAFPLFPSPALSPLLTK